MSQREHFVQFYETDDFFLDSLCPFISSGLQAGDAAVVVAPRSHLPGLENRLFYFAIQLEQLWNPLRETNPFTLFCAYPIKGFAQQMLGQPLADVCATHSRVIPAESYAALHDSDEQLRAIIRLQQKAISLEAEVQQR